MNSIDGEKLLDILMSVTKEILKESEELKDAPEWRRAFDRGQIAAYEHVINLVSGSLNYNYKKQSE